ncbi:MAG: hypothetical protein ACYDD1_05380 [Caulobacteraceae bacterium]
MVAPSSHQTHSPAWYIQAAGRVWGPYPYSRMAEFVGEGRLSPGSLVGAHPGGPFGAAEFRRELLDLFAPAMPGAASPSPQAAEPKREEPRQAAAQRPEPSPAIAAPTESVAEIDVFADPPAPAALQPVAASTSMVPARAMVVWADLASLTPVRFEAVLAAYGPYASIRPGLWLVQARMSPSALRNALSRRLRTEDALLVLQAPLEQVAWFNLAPTAERDLRHLWGSPAG